MKLSIYRYDPDKDERPYMKDYEVQLEASDRMLLDALVKVKVQDDSIAFRRSCREGVCGSDAININGKNGLACITKVAELPEHVTSAAAWPAGDPRPDRRHDAVLQAVPLDQALRDQQRAAARARAAAVAQEREELNGLYECILCACCSTACPSFWWNPDKFVGPAGLLQAYRFIADTRDQATTERLDNLEDPYRLFRCHTIMNCVDVCPKGLNPTRAIGKIKEFMVGARSDATPWTASRNRLLCGSAAAACSSWISFCSDSSRMLRDEDVQPLRELLDLPDNDLWD